jgi:hypothetical protein
MPPSVATPLVFAAGRGFAHWRSFQNYLEENLEKVGKEPGKTLQAPRIQRLVRELKNDRLGERDLVFPYGRAPFLGVGWARPLRVATGDAASKRARRPVPPLAQPTSCGGAEDSEKFDDKCLPPW